MKVRENKFLPVMLQFSIFILLGTVYNKGNIEMLQICERIQFN